MPKKQNNEEQCGIGLHCKICKRTQGSHHNHKQDKIEDKTGEEAL